MGRVPSACWNELLWALVLSVPTFLATLADVAISAVGVGGWTTEGGVETVADVWFASAGTRGRGRVQTLSAGSPFRCGFGAIWHEDGRIKPREGLVVGEEASLASLDDVANGDIKHDDARVRVELFGLEFAIDEVTVGAEFFGAMREGKSNRLGGKSPS